jgi:DNA (cytosine-5)-methyltransferase 1
LPRVITVREAARLHGYPDWFRFHATKWHGFRQIGNSVPPPLARPVASSLLKADSINPAKGRMLHEDRDESLLWLTAGRAEQHFGIESRVIPQRDRKAE